PGADTGPAGSAARRSAGRGRAGGAVRPPRPRAAACTHPCARTGDSILKYRGKEATVSDPVPLAGVADPPRPALEVADIVRRYGPAFLDRHGPSLSATQRRALAAVAACRTAAL